MNEINRLKKRVLKVVLEVCPDISKEALEEFYKGVEKLVEDCLDDNVKAHNHFPLLIGAFIIRHMGKSDERLNELTKEG